MSKRASQVFAIVVIAFIGVWSGNHALDAIILGQAAHFLRDVPGLRTIVDFGQYVGMDVDHACREFK
jgi:hypothetical protein